MALYLSFDGVDDYLQLPSVSFTKIEINFISRQPKDVSYKFLFDARPGLGGGYVYVNGGVDAYNAFNRVYVDNALVTNATVFIPIDQKIVLRAEVDTTSTDDIRFCAIFDGGGYYKADIYDIKIYNGAVLVAHYDMTTGTVNDQSGNGNHATLTGGTWLDDGGSAGTIHTANGTSSGVTTLSANLVKSFPVSGVSSGTTTVSGGSTVIQSANGESNGTSSVTELTGINTKTASGESSGTSSVTGACTLVKQSQGTSQGSSSVPAQDPLRTLYGVAAVNGEGWASATPEHIVTPVESPPGTHTGSGTSSGGSTVQGEIQKRQIASGEANGNSNVIAFPIKRQSASSTSNGASSAENTFVLRVLSASGSASATSSVSGACVKTQQSSGASTGASSVADYNPLRTLYGTGTVDAQGWATAYFPREEGEEFKQVINGIVR